MDNPFKYTSKSELKQIQKKRFKDACFPPLLSNRLEHIIEGQPKDHELPELFFDDVVEFLNT